ncbi:hypothetical protein ATCC90586_002011 [Pythium insidiosum]|nr:hypothetical protein ATCC90586_002011 [Pythium insidiosum]
MPDATEARPAEENESVLSPIDIPLYVSIPTPAQPSSPLFAPTAPEFEFLVLDESAPAALDVNGERAKQLAFGKTGGARSPPSSQAAVKGSAVSRAAPVSPARDATAASSPSSGVDFLALAFNAKSSLADQSASSHLEEQASATEFSF